MLALLSEIKRSGPVFYIVSAVVLLSFMAASAIFLLYREDAEADPDRSIDCTINRGSCVKDIGGTGLSATFDIDPKPVKTMKDLHFRLELRRDKSPLTDGDVVLDLAMPGMYMARNNIRLVHKGEGRYEGDGVIVKCPSGMRRWKADITVETPSYGAGKQVGVDYTFVVE